MILRLDSEKLAETLIFGKKMAIFWPKKGPKRVQNFDGRILNSFFHKQDTVWLVPRKESKFKEVSYQKLGRFIAALGNYTKTLKTVNFCQKMAKFSS